MAILQKGNTFATNQQVTATTLNNLVDNATFDTGAVDNSTTQLSGGAIIVKDGGVTPAKLSTGKPTWDSSGNVTTTGDLTVGDDLTVTGQAAVTELLDLSAATAGQVKFPATQNASSDPNTFDDYEEGTWTPDLGGTATYTTRTGLYTKLGRMVYITGYIQVNSIGSGSTYEVSGLPFAAANTFAEWPGSVATWTSTAASFQSVGCRVNGGASTLQMTAATGSGTSNSTAPNFFGNSTVATFSAAYSV